MPYTPPVTGSTVRYVIERRSLDSLSADSDTSD